MRKLICKIIAVTLGFYALYILGTGIKEILWYRSLFLGSILTLAFLHPRFSRSAGNKMNLLLNYLLAIAAFSASSYILFNYQRIISRWPMFSPVSFWDQVFGLIMLLVLLEAVRRILGWALAVITALSLAYLFTGPYLPGILQHRGFALENLIDGMYLTVSGGGLFSIPTGIASSYVLLFVVFGALLSASGAGDLFFNLANSLVGKLRGGPAKVSILASGFFGSLSGSPVADVATTGAFTIPIMKRIGYRSDFAAAIEAAASTAGTFTPPVMGSVAFLMAEFAGTSYASIALMFVLPAFVYYFSLYYGVHLEALKTGLKGVETGAIIPAKQVFKEKGHLLLPLIVLVVLLILGRTAVNAGLWTIVAMIAASQLQAETRLTLTSIISAIQKGVENTVPIATACAAAGIIMGVLSISGLGGKLVSLILSFSLGVLPLALILTMLTSIILGMALPISAAYIVVSVVAVPALVELGVEAIPAHVFTLFFAALSTITPPVALTAYTAAGIAGSRPMQTGLKALKLGLAGFMLPFIIVYDPSLLLRGSLLEIMLALVSALVGVTALNSALHGWLARKISYPERVILLAAALFLLFPGWLSDLFGGMLFLLVLISQKSSRCNANGGISL